MIFVSWNIHLHSGNGLLIPKIYLEKNASDKEIFNHLIGVSGPEYFSIEGSAGILPFFVQAAKELGYYGYDTEAFENLLVINNADNYIL